MAEPSIRMNLEMNGYKVPVLVTHFHPKAETPKSYGKCVCMMSRPHGNYETGLVKIFKCKDGTYRAGTYVEGCFYMQYAKIKFTDDSMDRINKMKDDYNDFRINNNNSSFTERQEMKKKLAVKYNLVEFSCI